MKIRAVFKEAQRDIFARRGLVGALYLVNVIVGVVVMLPMILLLNEMATSPLAGKLVTSVQLDTLWELMQEHGSAFGQSMRYIFFFGFLYIVLQTFLAGGIVGILAHEPRFQLRIFLHESGMFFGRFFRLSLLSLPMLLLFVILFGLTCVLPLVNLSADLLPPAQNRVFLVSLALFVVFVSFWNMIFDYAKVLIAIEDKKSSWGGFWAAVKFIATHFRRTTVLYFINLIILLTGLGASIFLISYFGSDATPAIFLTLVVQQFTIIFRLWMKISFIASSLHVVRYKDPEIPSVKHLFTPHSP